MMTKEQGSFFTKNQVLEVACTDMNVNGYGVARVDGFVIFTKGLLLHEIAKVKLVKVFKRYAYAIIEELLLLGKSRTTPICSVYPRCGGCNLMHMDYQHQLQFKQTSVQQQLDYHHVKHVKVNQTLGMTNPFAYRNKVICPVRVINSKLEIGFYRQHSHDIVVFDTCHVQSNLQNKIIESIKAFQHVPLFEIVKHIVLREVYEPSQIMLGLVTNQTSHPHLQEFLKVMINNHPEIKSIILNHNPHKTNTIFTSDNYVLFGQDHLIDHSLGLSFKLSLQSFFQVNTDMMQVLYQEALEAADIQPTDTVLDLYCGIGTLALLASQQAKYVYGVELNPKAIADANDNAQNNKIENVKFIQGDVKEAMSYFETNDIECDVVIVDPPRAGLHEDIISSLKQLKAKRIIYVSCNPTTLGRDLKLFESHYKIENVQPVDMFPQTYHVECVVLMSRVEK